jgi:hypothetical protein
MTGLLHYTNAQNALGIIRDGEIINGVEKSQRRGTQRSVIQPEFDDLIDGVIWLTTLRAAKQAWQGLDFKHHVRFAVDVDDAIAWPEFADTVGLPDWYRTMLEYPGTKPETWYITTKPITIDAWTKITLTDGERRIWRKGDPIEQTFGPVEYEIVREQAKLRTALASQR